MSPRTKGTVKNLRWIQLGLRVLTLIGALGMLFVVICVQGTSGSVGWIIRVAVSFLLLCCRLS